jgi:hypothetical protein
MPENVELDVYSAYSLTLSHVTSSFRQTGLQFRRKSMSARFNTFLRCLCRSLWGAALLLTVGCRAAPPPPAPPQLHIRGLWHLHLEYLTREGKPPVDADELKTWAENNLAAERLQAMGVTSVEDAFVSPRDGLPYVLRPMRIPDTPLVTPRGKPGEALAMPIMIYESQGVSGQRLVMYATGIALEISEDALQRALSRKN